MFVDSLTEYIAGIMGKLGGGGHGDDMARAIGQRRTINPKKRECLTCLVVCDAWCVALLGGH